MRDTADGHLSSAFEGESDKSTAEDVPISYGIVRKAAQAVPPLKLAHNCTPTISRMT